MSRPFTPGSNSKPEKTMSSRLLTMKFMQRAAASNSNASTPIKSTPSTPAFDSHPSPKRQKLSSDPPTPAIPITPRSSDLQAISAALAAEEHKRAEAVARQANDAGETQWVLRFEGDGMDGNSFGNDDTESVLDVPAMWNNGPVYISASSYSAADEDFDGEGQSTGRRTYGNFKRKKQVRKSGDEEAEGSASERNEGSDEDDEDQEGDVSKSTAAMIRRAKEEATMRTGREQGKKRKKEVNLNKLTSISGGGNVKSGSDWKKHAERSKEKKRRKEQGR